MHSESDWAMEDTPFSPSRFQDSDRVCSAHPDSNASAIEVPDAEPALLPSSSNVRRRRMVPAAWNNFAISSSRRPQRCNDRLCMVKETEGCSSKENMAPTAEEHNTLSEKSKTKSSRARWARSASKMAFSPDSERRLSARWTSYS